MVSKVLPLPTVGIHMGIDPAAFWANLYLCNFESKCIINLIRTNKLRVSRFHCIFKFIDKIFALNDGGEFVSAFLKIYPTELECKVEHNGSH